MGKRRYSSTIPYLSFSQCVSPGEVLKAIRNKMYKNTPWPESASKLYRPSDRRLSGKLVPTFEDRGCHMVSVTYPYGRIPGFPDRSRYFSFQVAPQLYSRSWVEPVPDPLLIRKYGSAANRTRNSRSVATNSWVLDHKGCRSHKPTFIFFKIRKIGCTCTLLRAIPRGSFLGLCHSPFSKYRHTFANINSCASLYRYNEQC
jgi:hypothetical protein